MPESNRRVNVQRLDRAFGALQAHPLAAELRSFVSTAPEEALFHINPAPLAKEWGVDRNQVLDILLRAVRAGVVSLQWAFHCPTCGGVAKESLNLSASHEHDYCPVCRVDFHNTLDQNIEVFFSVGPEVRSLPSKFQEEYEVAMMGAIEREGAFTWEGESAVRGVEVLNHPVFRSMFGEDTLPLDQSLEIQSATVLFTDVTGSTQLYERLGDTKAYRLIRDHFDRVFEAITSQGGAAVKTIGDAVMGVFRDEVSAIRAAMAMTDALESSDRQRDDGTEIWLKIGLHRGPVIVVTLNDRLDYFGRTVNIAARVQQMSGPRELSMLEDVVKAPGVTALLKERVNTVSRSATRLKGIDDTARLYRVRMSREASSPENGSS